MSILEYVNKERRMVHCCGSLIAFALMAAPSLTFAQAGDCNATSNVSKTPTKVYALGETVQVTYTFGAGTLSDGLALTVNDARAFVSLDCDTALTGTQRENCLGFNGEANALAADDGDAITYAGNLSFGDVGDGNACGSETFEFVALNHGDGIPPEADPNILVFEANEPIIFDEGERCFITFDAVVNGIGLPPNWDVGNQIVNSAGGFTGACTSTLGASSTQSTAYEIEITPQIDLTKEVSVDGGPWFDANSAPYPVGYIPGSTAEYRLIVENVGEEPLTNVLLNDNTPPFFLGLNDVPLPDRCYDPDSGYFEVGATCTIVSGDSGFGGLGTPPVAVCETAEDKVNLACVDAEGAASSGAVNACDPAGVSCLAPGIEVNKDGPTLAKIGDTITYQICASNTGGVNLNNCVVDDDMLGLVGAAFPDLPIGATNVCLTPAPTYIIPGDATDPLLNTAKVTCDVVGTSTTIDDDDDHSVNLFTTEIDVRKDGPTEAKAGDSISYDICATNLSSLDAPEFDACTVTDSMLGLSAAPFPVPAVDGSEVCLDPQAYDIPVDATGTVDNSASVTCTFADYDNAPSDSDTHSVPLFEMTGDMVKVCDPDPVMPGEDICWTITVNNTGDKDFTCLVNDATAGYIDEPLVVTAGASNFLETCRTVLDGEVGSTISNTASALCSNALYDNVVDPCLLNPENCSADCEVPPEVTAICRTPGFWGTHAGTEKDGRSFNLAQEVIDYNGGSLGTICGVEITSTDVYNLYGPDYQESALEAICVHPKTNIVRQLMRQMTAAALNCVMSGTTPDCAGLSIGMEWAGANAACAAGDVGDYIEKFDAFNNGYYEGSECIEDLKESPVWQTETPGEYVHKLPGAAGSSQACNFAIQNDWFLVPVNGLDD